jgi:general secretion pathway protein D
MMNKPPLSSTVASLLSLSALTPALVLPPGAFANGDGTFGAQSAGSVVAREQARRADYARRAEAAIEVAARAYKERDYETAVAQYKLACDLVSPADYTRSIYNRALDGFCNASIKLAEQRISEGRYADAENILKLVLSESYRPNYRAAVVLLHRLEEPGYYNRTIGPVFRGKVEEVKKLLLEAQGFFDSARYDLAFKRCEQVLNLDNYNIAARKMEERINKERDNYALASYAESRSRAIWQTDQAWANPVRKFGLREGGVIIQDQVDAAGTARINAKLQRIIIPRVEFKDATIREAVEFLKRKSFELDTTETDPAKKGVNIVVKLEQGGGGGAVPAPALPEAPAIPGLPTATTTAEAPVTAGISPADARITISLANVPLAEALRYVTDLANLKYKVERYAVSIVPRSANIETLITKEYKVRPGFISRVAGGGGGGDALAPTAPADATKGGSSIAGRMDAKEFLTASGVNFPQGATATYMPTSSRLIVRNTRENLDLIDTLVEADTGTGPAQVEIESKFVEITQNNLKELSFDWLLGQFNITSEDGIFAGGGTSGTSPKLDQLDFPFPIQNGPYTTYPVTQGNRSGGLAISQNAIDSLLFGTSGASKLAPAIAGIAGIMTDPSFQLVIRALNQKKGVDLLSAPKVTTKSGQRAVIEIIREFRYPTEFDPPQIPQNFGNTGGIVLTPGLSQAPGSFPVTPTTPTTFETRNTGVTLEVEPVIGPDSYTIDLSLVPQVVEFEGFINYGSPIQTTSTNALGISQTNIITPNVINQPIFSTRKVTTNVSIFDGQTVLLGGLIREDVQKVEDKTPLLGDIPFIGRLFRSQVDQHLKRHLVIFVSARLINPAGEPTRLEEEKEEIVETLPLPEAEVPLPLMPK